MPGTGIGGLLVGLLGGDHSTQLNRALASPSPNPQPQ
jgi:hypothetical protein